MSAIEARTGERYRVERVTLAAFAHAGAQLAVDAWRRALPPDAAAAIAIEGAFVAVEPPPDVPLIRVASGCLCCAGHQVLRVELVRLLRRARPRYLLLLVVAHDHRETLATQLAAGALGFDAGHIEVF